MQSFQVDLSKFSVEIRDFVDSFAQTCYVVGGKELLLKYNEELTFRLTDGEDFVTVISSLYERFRTENF